MYENVTSSAEKIRALIINMREYKGSFTKISFTVNPVNPLNYNFRETKTNSIAPPKLGRDPSVDVHGEVLPPKTNNKTSKNRKNNKTSKNRKKAVELKLNYHRIHKIL